MRQPKLSDMSASAMIQTNWKFVETLLQEGKTKVHTSVYSINHLVNPDKKAIKGGCPIIPF